jgi:hypothetical protein
MKDPRSCSELVPEEGSNRVLDDQQTIAETLKREQGITARHIFCYTKGQKSVVLVSDRGTGSGLRCSAAGGNLLAPAGPRL